MDEQTSLVQRLAALAAEQPDQIGYVHLAMDGSEVALSWREIDQRSTHLAGAFLGRGVGFGDRVGLGIRNSCEFVFAVFACWKVGAIPVPVRWDVPDWELERLREVIDPKLYVGPDDLSWLRSTADAPLPELPDVVSPHVNGICSSGSTGTPKVILLSNPAVYDDLFSTPMMELWTSVARPQRILVLAPMYHVNAFATFNNMMSGDRLFVLEKFDAARIVDVIERHGITTFTATPTMLQRIADLPGVDDRDLSSLEWILQGAAPMPPSLVHRWAGLIGPEKIVMAYGMTEGLGLTALRGDEWQAHEGSVGRGIRGTEVRVLDADGCDLPPDVIGEIFLRSPVYARATYLGQAPQLHLTDDGFGTVGDMGYLDADAYLYLVDRRVDMIITGGANVFPAEVEKALIDHPKIADIVVIGLKDPEWGRRVHAIVEPMDPADPPTYEEIKAYAKRRLLPYKVPKSLELVDEIPRSEATKVNRGRLVAARGG